MKYSKVITYNQSNDRAKFLSKLMNSRSGAVGLLLLDKDKYPSKKARNAAIKAAKPYCTWDPLATLMAPGDSEKNLAMELVFPGGQHPYKHGVKPPYLSLAPVFQLGPSQIMAKVSVLTVTTKMRCASFSLPAGPSHMKIRHDSTEKPKIVPLGGTCSQADNVKLFTHGKKVQRGYICHGCYAGAEGNYQYRSVQLTQLVRREWVRRLLEHSGPEGFANEMVRVLRAWFSRPRFHDLGNKKGGIVSLSPRHFRIHDSGDIGWAKGYVEAWIMVAHAMPEIRFWGPTRDWVTASKLKEFRGVPDNLVIRPSALFYGTPAPGARESDVPNSHLALGELASGSSVIPLHEMAPPDVLHRALNELDDTRGQALLQHTFNAILRDKGLADWDCPAYRSDTHDCESANGGKGCRVCWDRPDLSINYTPHSLGASIAKNVALQVNPGRVGFEVIHGNGGTSGPFRTKKQARDYAQLVMANSPSTPWEAIIPAEQLGLPDNEVHPVAVLFRDGWSNYRESEGVTMREVNDGARCPDCGDLGPHHEGSRGRVRCWKCGLQFSPKRRKNPLMPLEEALAGYGLRRNPPAGSPAIEAYLNRQGISPSDYTEGDWRRVLAERGVEDYDEQTGWLEGMGEW